MQYKNKTDKPIKLENGRDDFGKKEWITIRPNEIKTLKSEVHAQKIGGLEKVTVPEVKTEITPPKVEKPTSESPKNEEITTPTKGKKAKGL